ncbi:MAG: diguanylate cyclase [Desulfobulbaceae bacterium]|jgi:diguanylate cyclase (GGDEF)-like protein|nr:diguanylate cyclase [Desulfobulbaceae bacterium]
MESGAGNITILVVDSDELVRITISVLVDSFSYRCLVAGDAPEALAILATTDVDIVIVDLRLPEIDGLELLATICEQYRRVGVIIAADLQERVNYVDIIRRGAIDLVRKPIDPEELEAKLLRVGREREMLRKMAVLSSHDELTGLSNQRGFEDELAKEMERAFRQRYTTFAALIVIEDFRQYIERYGHAAGDHVLLTMTEILRECTREMVDTLARLREDEFAVVLPQTTPDQAAEIIQRVMLSFVENGFAGLYLSIGVVSCPRNESNTLTGDMRASLAEMRHALADARNDGKNCVIFRS